MQSDKLLHGLGLIQIPTIALPPAQPSGFDKFLTNVNKTANTISTVKNAISTPGKSTQIVQPSYTPPPPTDNKPNYLKIGLIVGAVALAGFAGYKILNK